MWALHWCGPCIEQVCCVCQGRSGHICLTGSLPYSQVPVPTLPLPRGNKDCPKDCSGVGNCDYDTGTCYCPAGYGGPDCATERQRPCVRMGADKRDESWTKYPEWSHSRCAGIMPRMMNTSDAGNSLCRACSPPA